MIPAPADILAGFRFAARRWKLSGEPSERSVTAAVEDATQLAADDAAAEPAALFFAFARRPRTFPGAWRLMPALLAMNQAKALGLRLRTERDELNRLLTRIAGRELSYEERATRATARARRPSAPPRSERRAREFPRQAQHPLSVGHVGKNAVDERCAGIGSRPPSPASVDRQPHGPGDDAVGSP